MANNKENNLGKKLKASPIKLGKLNKRVSPNNNCKKQHIFKQPPSKT